MDVDSSVWIMKIIPRILVQFFGTLFNGQYNPNLTNIYYAQKLFEPNLATMARGALHCSYCHSPVLYAHPYCI